MSERKKTALPPPPGAVLHDISPRIRAAAGTGAALGPVDDAEITGAPRELAHAQDAVEEAREVRTERVEALRAEIASGAYQPDPREIAQAILQRGL